MTVLLSNDATAVVLTPAVYAATRAAKVEPLPYLFVCAFIANAASFVLPISNPANLVVFGKAMPPLADWLRAFAAPSLAAILATYLALRLTQRRALGGEVAAIGAIAPLTRGGKLTAIGILATAIVLLTASALDRDLGLPTFIAGAVVTVLVLAIGRQSPLAGVVGYFLVGAAAGGRPVHPGRRPEPDRRAAGAGARSQTGLDRRAAANSPGSLASWSRSHRTF